jgi:hypothetical protein
VQYYYPQLHQRIPTKTLRKEFHRIQKERKSGKTDGVTELTKHPHRPHAHEAPNVWMVGREEQVE